MNLLEQWHAYLAYRSGTSKTFWRAYLLTYHQVHNFTVGPDNTSTHSIHMNGSLPYNFKLEGIHAVFSVCPFQDDMLNIVPSIIR